MVLTRSAVLRLGDSVEAISKDTTAGTVQRRLIDTSISHQLLIANKFAEQRVMMLNGRILLCPCSTRLDQCSHQILWGCPNHLTCPGKGDSG